MKPGFFVTYEIVTEESAANGEAESMGFVSPGEWHTEDRPEPVTLREALRLVYPNEDCGSWFASTSPIEDRAYFELGHHETRSLHPPDGITPSSYRRLKRLLRIR
jgi:hypothetical protein